MSQKFQFSLNNLLNQKFQKYQVKLPNQNLFIMDYKLKSIIYQLHRIKKKNKNKNATIL